MTSSTASPSGERVLVLLSPGPDASLAHAVLDPAGRKALYCADVPGLCRELEAGAGAAVVAEEMLDAAGLRALVGVLDRQEAWSDFPLVVFFRNTGTAQTSLRLLDMLEPLGNVTVL